MPLQETSGNVTTDAYGGGVAAVPQYIEDVFSTYLYTGNGSTQTITNGIDLSTKGGLVWIKRRNGANSNTLVDSATSSNGRYYLISDLTDAQQDTGTSTFPFTSSGFSLNSGPNQWNGSAQTYASWTFRKQAKFFDVVTYSGNSVVNRAMPHNLGSVPGCIIVKTTTAAGESWIVWHRSGTQINSYAAVLDSTAGYNNRGASLWGTTAGTPDMNASTFSLGTNTSVNETGQSYVAYLFAHDAGGFGLTGTDNVISCGSYATDGSGVGSATLGWEPQWLLLKVSSGASNWILIDNMRGFVAPGGGNSANLVPNSSASEQTVGIKVNATGFTDPGVLVASGTVIYIAIRRGPMKVPTVGTSVFSPVAYTGTGTGSIQTITTNFPVDAYIQTSRQSSYTEKPFGSRLTGQEKYIPTNSNGVEQTLGSGNGTYNATGFASNTGLGLTGDWNNPSSPNYSPYITWNFRRAPSVFDVVCYVGTSSANQRITHNLTVVPELIITRPRDGASSWYTYSATIGRSGYVYIDSTTGTTSRSNVWGTSNPTTTDFGVDNTWLGYTGLNVVAYLFATCAGVSKVGSYTGNGTTQTIDCSFTTGARFVLIKRTNATGGWYVYDTARGMTTLTDPYIFTNNTSPEVATLGSVTTVSTGFALNSTILAAINESGGTYIFLAIA
jgi:hypothetical protein